jgi:hypothetical protein
MRRALHLRSALQLGITVGLDDILANEFYAVLIADEERNRLERETDSSQSGFRSRWTAGWP